MCASSRRVIDNLRVRGLLELLDAVCRRRGAKRDELAGAAALAP